ncbi:MAG: extensin, partial [Xanthobacteraceae bacterium]
MLRGVRWSLVCSFLFVVLLALAGCGHFFFAERDSWRHDAEVSCLNSGAVKETPQRVRISSIDGPGACGMDFPIRVSELGDSTPLGYDDEPIRPPGDIPQGTMGGMPPSWPGAPSSAPPFSPIQSSAIQSHALAPARGSAPQSYPYATKPSYSPPPRSYPPPATTGAVGVPLSLNPPGVPLYEDAEDDIGIPGGPPHPYYGGPQSPYDASHGSTPQNATPSYSPYSPPPLGPQRAPGPIAAGGPVEVSPPATLACPIVSALDQW